MILFILFLLIFSQACKWFIESMANDATWPRQLLFQCTSSETRDSLAGLMVHVLNLLIPYERPIYNEQVELMEIDTIPKVFILLY